MQIGSYDFEVFQLAYIDAYVHGQTELMAFIMHANFNNVRVGTVKSKLEFIKIVDFKIKNNNNALHKKEFIFYFFSFSIL